MISFNNNWISSQFSSFHLNLEDTKVLLNGIDPVDGRDRVDGIGPDLFSTKTKEGYYIELHLDEARIVLSYLTVFDIYRLSRVNKRFQACIHQVIGPVLQRASCMDFSNISLTQMMTYSLQESKISSLILKKFGSALVKAPFLGHFEDVSSIPPHDVEHALARGFVTCQGQDSDCDVIAPFISFYVGKRGERGSFKTSTVQQYEGRSRTVQSSIPALRFIYVGGMLGFHLTPYLVEEPNITKYINSYLETASRGTVTEDQEITLLRHVFMQNPGLQDEGLSFLDKNSLDLISEIFEGQHPRYALFTSEVPIRESISIKDSSK